MPTFNSPLKTIGLAALVAVALPVAAQDDGWYSGLSTGFWGLANSIGIHGTLPGVFVSPAAGVSPEGLSAQKQFGGYRVSTTFSIEGAQTSFGLNDTACGGDPFTGEDFRSCYGAAWSLSGVATLPFESGVSLYGRLGLHYWQKGASEETFDRRNMDDLGSVYGVGMSYEISHAVTLHAEMERYTDLSANGGMKYGGGVGLDASVHSIGMSVRF